MINHAFQINLVIIFSICLASWLVFLKLIKGIKTAVGGNACDNSYLIRTAAKSSEWKWPSDMHTKTYTGTSTSQRDITVLLLVIFQKIFRDKNGEFPIVALWGFANAASVFLLYLVGSNYWDPNVALFVSILYLVSFWPWQISLYVAHLNIGTMFFLLAVYFTTLSIGAAHLWVYIWLLAAGLSFCCMLFSSSSSPRYILLFFAAILFAKQRTYGLAFNSLSWTIILTLTILALLILTRFFYKQIITAIYYRRAGFLNGIIIAKKYSLDHYLKTGKEKLETGLRIIIKPYIFLFILVNLIGFNYFIPIFLGFSLVFLILTLPNIKKTFTFFFNYLYISYIKAGSNSQIVTYAKQGYFAKQGINPPHHPRGGGFGWVPKIFFRMAPFHTLIYITALAAIIVNYIFSASPILSIWSLLFLTIASLSPILWAELTKAYQVSRSYSSGLIGFLIVIGYSAYIFQGYAYFWPIAFTVLSATFAWNLWRFTADIYPARMSFNKIIRAFDKFKIKELYTYNTSYNESFLDNIAATSSFKNLKINFIKSLSDVNEGWILVPPTTHKAGYIRQEESIEDGDFAKDPILNELLETKKIEKIADVKFKTIQGSDNIWGQESDIITYLDLMLHYISGKDRFRGYAWLLHSSKLQG